MTLRRVLSFCTPLIVAAVSACSGGSAPAVPPVSSPQSQCAQPAASSYDERFEVRDDFMRPIAHTHVLASNATTESAQCLIAHGGSALRYHGGLVQTAPKIYVVFWGFQTYGDPQGESTRLTAFLNAVGASQWLNSVTQYYQNGPSHIANSSGQLAGSWYDDTNPVPARPTDSNVRTEAVRLAQHFGV